MNQPEQSAPPAEEAGPRPLGGRPAWRRRVVGAALAAALVAAMALDTTYRSAEEAASAGQDEAFDAATYAEEHYDSEVLAAIEDNAVELAELLAALDDDEAAAGEEYGHREGSSGPYSFAVRATGEAGEADSGQLPVEVAGLPGDVDVALQTGPAITGTALRDATGVVSFDQFTNQLEYREAATALNETARQRVFGELDPAELDGAEITVTGAFSRVNPALVLITPVELEVAR